MNINKRIITSNFTSGRSGRQIKQITPHTAVSGAKSLFDWFNRSTTQASTHFYVNGDGLIEQYVEEGNTAWANSNWNANCQALTYETWDNGKPDDPVRTDAMYESAAQLTAYLAKKYNIPLVLLTKEQALANQAGITLHRYYASKSCPAGLNVQRIIDRAKIINQTPMEDFKYEIYMKGTDMYMRVLSGSINEKIKIENLDTGWVGTPNCIKSVGNDGNAINANVNPAHHYRITAKGVVVLFPVVVPEDPKDKLIKELQGQVATLTQANNALIAERDNLQAELNKFKPVTFYQK